MADGSLARRYARALVELGRENNDVDKFGADLRKIAEVLGGPHGELMGVLMSPAVTLSERRGVLGAVVARLDMQVHTKSFLSLLVDKNRFALFFDILREYQALADELGNRVRATVTTAAPVDDALQKRIGQALGESVDKQVEVEFKVDKDLIGGLVAQVGGKVFDASVRARLQDLQNSLLREVAEA